MNPSRALVTVHLDAQSAADWVMGTSDRRAEVERLARELRTPVAISTSIGVSLGVIWPDGKHSNLPDDQVKEQVRQQFRIEKEQSE